MKTVLVAGASGYLGQHLVIFMTVLTRDMVCETYGTQTIGQFYKSIKAESNLK